MIKRIAAISVLAGTVFARGGGVAFAAPPPTPPGNDNGHGATVTNFHVFKRERSRSRGCHA